ncbi:hypothetical protein KAR91_43580 [Candidatus Pacearchaeota archaeon]|nr:hypothetical protein [Candidatus Pacearchaeota archaeon]
MRKLTILIALFALLFGNVQADQVTENYEFVIPAEGGRNWGPTISADILSIDSILFIISEDVQSISDTTIIISDDIVTLEEFAAILSSDVNLISNTVVIMSADVNAISDTVVIISNDIIDINEKANILSSDTLSQDANIINNINNIATISDDVAQLPINTEAIAILSADTLSQDANIINNINAIGILSSDTLSQDAAIIANQDSIIIISDDVQAISNTVVIMSADIADISLGGLTEKVTIISSDVNAISNTVVIISNDLAGRVSQPVIQFTITDPENIPILTGRLSRSAIVWTNESARTFNVEKITAYSDEDDYQFAINISSSLTNLSVDGAGQTTMDVVVCDTDGTFVFYKVIESGFDDSTVLDNQHVIFTHEGGTAGMVKTNIFGNYN